MPLPEVAIPSLSPQPLPLSHLEPYEMAEFVSPWQGFRGVPCFVRGMSRQILSIAVLKLTHRSASHKKNGHTC